MTLSHISCSYIIPYYIPSCQPTISKSNIIHILSIQIFVSHDCPTYNTLIYFSFRPAAVQHLLSYTPIKCPLYITFMPYTYCSPSYPYQIPDTYINHYCTLLYFTSISYHHTLLSDHIISYSLHIHTKPLIPYIHLYLSFHTHIPLPSILIILIPYSYLSYISLIISPHIVLPETASSLFSSYFPSITRKARQ